MGISLSGGPYSYNRFEEYERMLAEKQSKKDREDEHLGEKDGKESSKKQSMKDRRDEEEGEKKGKKKPNFWQDSDGDGKWYEKGEDVAESTNSYAMNSYVRALGRMGAMYDIHEESHEKEAKHDEKLAKKDEKESEYDTKKGKGKRAKELDDDAKQDDADAAEDVRKEAFIAGYEAALAEGAKGKLTDGGGTTHATASGSGMGWHGSKQGGIGKDKKIKNNPEADDARAKRQSDDAKAERRKNAQARARGEDPTVEAYTWNDYVKDYLIGEGYVNNEVSAEVLLTHMSDEWFSMICENPAVNPKDPSHPEETKAQASAQSKVRSGNMRGADKTKGVAKSPGTQGGPGIKNYNTAN